MGNYIHPIFEFLTLKQFYANNCIAKFEHNLDSDKGYIIDIILGRDEKFINNIERNQYVISIPKHIEEICIDFTISTEFKNIKNKFYKEYQAKNRLLVIVLVRLDSNKNKITLEKLQESFNSLSDVSFNENIRLISLDQFKNFLNLSSNLCRTKPLNNEEKNIIIEINNISNLIEEALISDLKVSELEQYSKRYKKFLENFSQK